MEGGYLGKNKGAFPTQYLDLIFSWSLDDILNHKPQVEERPHTFHSEEHPFSSFLYPLLEETRCELASSMEIIYKAPFAEISSYSKAKGNQEMLYDVTVGTWRNRFREHGKEPYRTLPGDLLILVDERPGSISDLQRVGRTWGFALVDEIAENGNGDDDSTSACFKVEASKHIEFQKGMFVVFLMNITTQKKIWNSLHMQGTNLREMAEMFKSIGKHKFAGECFTLAGCYNDAAEAYAKGDQFSNCLSACKKGKLFNKGMHYIKYWKAHGNVQDNKMEQIKQEFLESCALHHHELKHPVSMMRVVRAFCSMESMRVFLRSINCLDELLLLEEESGHFLDAAEIVKSWGDVLKEADLLEKDGQCLEPTMLILWYIFFSSLWGNGNNGWPLKQFPQKEQLCKKAMSLSEKDSENFYGHICRELEILSDQQSTLSELKKHLQASQKHRSLRGEILSIRKILDAHLHWNFSWYGWEDELPLDITKHSEGMIFLNRVSVRTLVFYWNMWKDHVVRIFQSLGSLDSEEPDEHEGHIEFSLDYFGVRKQCVNGNMVYLLVCKDADWIRSGGDNGVHEDGKRLTIDHSRLVFSIQSYWQLELVSVGIKVLETLEALHKLMSKGSAFRQSTCLLHIFEVSKFLLECSYLNLTDNNKKSLDNFLEISTTYYDLVFPLDWRRSVCEDFISLKETRLSLDLLDEIIFQNVNNIKGDNDHASRRTIGKVMMILCLGYRKPIALYEEILRVLRPKSDWERFFYEFWNGGLVDDVAFQLWQALLDCYRCNKRGFGSCVSSHSFVYLLDFLLFMTCLPTGFFFTTKSSFLQWFTHLGLTSTPSTPFLSCFADLVEEIVKYKKDTVARIKKSNINPEYYHPLLVLKLVMLLCLICLKVPDCSKVLCRLLVRRKDVASLLPKKFVSDLVKRKKGRDLNLNADVVAEAFISVEDPLLIMGMENGSTRIHAPCAIFVDVKGCSREEIMKVLFPTEKIHSDSDSNEVLSETESSSGNT